MEDIVFIACLLSLLGKHHTKAYRMIEEYDTGEIVSPEHISTINLTELDKDLFKHLRNIVFEEEYINDLLLEERERRNGVN
jgi:hypothetical protein